MTDMIKQHGLQVDANKQAIWIEGAVEPAYAAQAFQAIAEELARIRANDPALAEDLARAKNHVLARAFALPVAASQRAAMLEPVSCVEPEIVQNERHEDHRRNLQPRPDDRDRDRPAFLATSCWRRARRVRSARNCRPNLRPSAHPS